MAKEIKPIQCPKCGSTQKVEIRPDYYRCTNCDTEYFLDDDNITITHNVNYNNPVKDNVPVKKPAILFVALVCIFFVGTMSTFWLTSSPSGTTDVLPVTPDTTEYSWRDHDVVAFADQHGNPVLIKFGQLDIVTGEDKSKSGKYAVFYDFLSEKEIKTQHFDIPTANSENFRFETFSNGDIYAIANSSLLYKLNKKALLLEPVSAVCKEHPELSAGIADFDFISKSYGDGVTLLTNDGKNYKFYPIANLVYNDDQVRQAERALTVKNAKAKTRTYFDFSMESTSFPDEKLQLYKFVQKDNLGGPNDCTYFEWSSYYDNRSVLRKQPYRGTGDLLISFKDFTPGRLYFSPKILFYDDDYVLIGINTTAAKNAKVALQCLDAKTGTIVFTYAFNNDVHLYENAVRYKGGFVVFSSMFAVAVDMNGKLVKEFKLL